MVGCMACRPRRLQWAPTHFIRCRFPLVSSGQLCAPEAVNPNTSPTPTLSTISASRPAPTAQPIPAWGNAPGTPHHQSPSPDRAPYHTTFIPVHLHPTQAKPTQSVRPIHAIHPTLTNPPAQFPHPPESPSSHELPVGPAVRPVPSTFGQPSPLHRLTPPLSPLPRDLSRPLAPHLRRDLFGLAIALARGKLMSLLTIASLLDSIRMYSSVAKD